jgi:hypothetical protein
MNFLIRGQSGNDIKLFQQKLIQLNPLCLPRYGADGRLGRETFHALATCFKDQTIEDDKIVTLEQQVLVEQMIKSARQSDQVVYIDARGRSSKLEEHGIRPTSELDLVWHQTDCEMGEREERYYGVPVHAVVTRGGKIIQLHSVEYLLYAAHALNRKGISIEIEGHFEGIEGDLSTYPKYHKDAGRTPQRMPAIQIEAAKQCGRMFLALVEGYGGRLRYQLTHRQGVRGIRRRDPGSAVCREVILPLVEELGVKCPWEMTWADGDQVPEEWHPESSAAY